jgi:hypothetical protein
VTGPDHYRAAEERQQRARAVMDATRGPFAEMAPEERDQQRAVDLADAQVHALLALAAAAGLGGSLPRHDAASWAEVAGGPIAGR